MTHTTIFRNGSSIKDILKKKKKKRFQNILFKELIMWFVECRAVYLIISCVMLFIFLLHLFGRLLCFAFKWWGELVRISIGIVQYSQNETIYLIHPFSLNNRRRKKNYKIVYSLLINIAQRDEKNAYTVTPATRWANEKKEEQTMQKQFNGT